MISLQGIMPHKDGPLYHPRVAILSLGSHTVMEFYRHLNDSQHDPDNGRPHQPALSLFLPPRSLFVFTDALYADYFHCIREVRSLRLWLFNIVVHFATGGQ